MCYIDNYQGALEPIGISAICDSAEYLKYDLDALQKSLYPRLSFFNFISLIFVFSNWYVTGIFNFVF